MVELNEVYLVDYIRTPFSRSRPNKPDRDVFSEIRADHLTGYLFREMFEKRLAGKVSKEEVDEVAVGSSLQVHEGFLYGGRNPLMLGNMPASVPSIGTDRQCGSAMTAMHHGIMGIMTGFMDTFVAVGQEHMTRTPMNPQPHISAPLSLLDSNSDWFRADVDITTGFSMIQTAQRRRRTF